MLGNQSFLLIFLIIFPIGQHVIAAPLNNITRESAVTSAHYRRQSDVTFGSWTKSKDTLRSRVDTAKIRAKLVGLKENRSEATRRFSILPNLDSCSDARTIVTKNLLAKKPHDNFHIDFLMYDPADARERASADTWPGLTVAYDPTTPSSKMRLGLTVGIKCLPTRVVTTKRGLELRTGSTAWKITKREEDRAALNFKKELKQVRSPRK